ncbi:hypothetical protein GPECTOR_14g89 [Gonium pectorale]|uniref:Protein kinase domain-containing protein n=1 Tax=Gonium pectorale TaxID=33097 RepID=A0A150GMS0_GONPE|nr:hypothetical protein GPECTOR_14g89 [Gonium pectorale]|eukprot:KXZ51107.1 hypothetical protein GPECTOR_14g89 [Gonium pectorale]
MVGTGARPVTIDMHFVRGKVRMGSGNVLILRRVVLLNFRSGSFNQAPGLDLLAPLPAGESSIVWVDQGAIVIRACFPLEVAMQAASILTRRPEALPGTNVLLPYDPPPGCTNSSAAPALDRCYVYGGRYVDIAITGQDLGPLGSPTPNGYVMYATDVLVLCASVLSDECITRLGPLGCVLYTFSLSPSPGAPAQQLPGGGGGAGATGLVLVAAAVAFALRLRQQQRQLDSQRLHFSVMDPAARHSHSHDGDHDGDSFPLASRAALSHPSTEKGLSGSPQRTAVLQQLPRGSQDKQRRSAGGASGAPEATALPVAAAAPGSAPVVSPLTPQREDLQLDVRLVSAQQRHTVGTDGANSSALCTGGTGTGSTGYGAFASGAGGTDSTGTGSHACAAGGIAYGIMSTSEASHAGSRAGGGDDVVTLLPEVLGKGAFGRVPSHRQLPQARARSVRSLLTVRNRRLLDILPRSSGRKPAQGPRPASVAMSGPPSPLPPTLPPSEEPSRAQLTEVQQPPSRAECSLGQLSGVQVAADGQRASAAGPRGSEGPAGPARRVPTESVGLFTTEERALELELAESHADLFAAEVAVLGRCDHPNVVRLLAACLTPPRLCLVMERCDTSLERMIYGGMLHARAGESARTGHGSALIQLPTLLHIAIQICQGLEYLHPTIVHRDLKPANVLINGADSATPVAKLADFGLARIREMTLPTINPEAGTPAYVAPECYEVKNDVLSHRVDMYSLGVLLWAMLTGQQPWKGYSVVAVAYKVAVLGERLPLEQLPDRRCPPKLRRLIRQCWEADPRRRPAAAEAVKVLHLVQQEGALARQLEGVELEIE